MGKFDPQYSVPRRFSLFESMRGKIYIFSKRIPIPPSPNKNDRKPEALRALILFFKLTLLLQMALVEAILYCPYHCHQENPFPCILCLKS